MGHNESLGDVRCSGGCKMGVVVRCVPPAAMPGLTRPPTHYALSTSAPPPSQSRVAQFGQGNQGVPGAGQRWIQSVLVVVGQCQGGLGPTPLGEHPPPPKKKLAFAGILSF